MNMDFKTPPKDSLNVELTENNKTIEIYFVW